MKYLLSSLLYILSFPNFISTCPLHWSRWVGEGLPWLAWVSLIPLISAIDSEKEIWPVIRNCLLCGWMIFLGSMYWLTKVTCLGYILVTFYLACFIALFGIIRFYNKGFIMVPLSWTALEFIRSNLLGGIPWLLLGASQYGFLSLIQISNITGVYGVSFLVALANIGILRRRIFWIFILLLVIGYGKIRYSGADKIRIGIVQPNVAQDIKWDPEKTEWILGRLEMLSKRVSDADLIIWPETAVPTLTETPGLLERIKGLRYNLILGSQGIDRDRRYYNSAFFVSGDMVEEHRKIHLVPFGEFVPFGSVVPFLKRLTPIEEYFTAGREYTVFRPSTINHQLSAIICFEDIFPGLARRFVQKGARILVNITNDGWFGKTAAVYQHAYLSVFRAVENGVPLVRATNTGSSCFIDYTGKIYPLQPFVETSEAQEIVVPEKKTFYTRYGDIFGWLCIIITGGLYVRRTKE